MDKVSNIFEQVIEQVLLDLLIMAGLAVFIITVLVITCFVGYGRCKKKQE